MKIAILSDIHANRQALEAVIADAWAQRVDSYAVAGDIVSDGPCPVQVLASVKSLTDHVIMGNREDYLLQYRKGERPGWHRQKQAASLLWTFNRLGGDDLGYISRLPEQLCVELDHGISLRVVHGSPFSMYELLKPNEDMAAVEWSALAVTEQALAFGHNHMQWTGTVHGRLLLNPGSVGVHFNRECKAEYGILTCLNGKLTAELRRVPYDFTALERDLAGSGLLNAAPVWPKITFEGVKAGRNDCLAFLNDAKAIMADENRSSAIIPNDIWDRVTVKWWREKGWGPCPV